MYLKRIEISNLRSFARTEIDFLSPDRRHPLVGGKKTLNAAKFPNMNVVLGGNGAGKTTLLRAIALAALGPVAPVSGLFPYRLVRRVGGQPAQEARIDARFIAHGQDGGHLGRDLPSSVSVVRREDVESLRWNGKSAEEAGWNGIFSEKSEAFFFVGFGSTRRVETREKYDPGGRRKSAFARARRVFGLFEEDHSLVPLSAWLPALARSNPGRHKQVCNLIDRLLRGTGYHFVGETERGEYLFSSGKLRVPFPALSDGYRAFLGWVGDLLFHVCETCPSGKKLVDNRGIAMVDEVDLHLHPKWQMTVLPTLSRALPNMQFIVTTHSPLVVGSMHSTNVISLTSTPARGAKIERLGAAVHGLDADQVLLTEHFGLKSTRTSSARKSMTGLRRRVTHGDDAAAVELLTAMAKGLESAT